MTTTKRPLDIAMERFADAVIHHGLAQISTLCFGGTNSDELTEAHIEMRCATAVLAWEAWRSGGLTEQLDPHYDDDTIDALLRGAQG